jgi:hypothetical protein
VNVETGEIVSLYVTYTARPRTMLGHRPAICYIASGWVEEQTTSGEVAGADLQFPCLVQRFRDPGVSGQRQVVLSYYVLNGQPTIHEDDFRSVRWRGPNMRRDSARYVAQVQIAAPIRWRVEVAEQTAREFATASVEGLLVLLPGGANDAVADARGDRLPGGDEAVGP